MNYSVYKHTFPNGKVYIGITSQKPEYRWANGKGYSAQPLMIRAISKYGWNNVVHEVLFDGLTKEEAEQKEIELIAYYKSNQKKFGYNIANGGNSVGVHSEETKRKISKANSGRRHTEEQKRKISESLKGEKHYLYGKHLSKETKKKISKSHKGKSLSEEAKKKIGEANKGENNYLYGKHLSEETKKKISKSMSGENHFNYGKQLSEELKRKISENSIGKNGKQVKCVETGIIYKTVTEASAQTKISKGNICLVCKGDRKTAGGYHWEYVDKEKDV